MQTKTLQPLLTLYFTIEGFIMVGENWSEWQKSEADVFWSEIAPCDHLVQIYENDEVFISSLEGFVKGGFETGEAVIIIATKEHLKELNRLLADDGCNLEKLMATGQYIPLVAGDVLARFMVTGWPDSQRFEKTATEILEKARAGTNRKVRAFGEMVALLWAQGYSGATVALEHLWTKFCRTEEFGLYCAYPKSSFHGDVNTSIMHICSAHNRIISGELPTREYVLQKHARVETL